MTRVQPIAGFTSRREITIGRAPVAEINITPLVDVMLVLLIIFLITIPVINKTVKVQLPKAVNIPTQTKPENITVAVDKDGDVDVECLIADLEVDARRRADDEG